jgi:hypothetical protein
MKHLWILFFAVLIGVALIPGTVAQRPGISKRSEEVPPTPSAIKGPGLTMNPNFGKVPLYFIPNKGQVNEKAKFYAKTSRYTLWMTREGLVFDSVRKVEEGRQTTDDGFQTKGDRQGSYLSRGGYREGCFAVGVPGCQQTYRNGSTRNHPA